jgi:hypothetical protein
MSRKMTFSLFFLYYLFNISIGFDDVLGFSSSMLCFFSDSSFFFALIFTFRFIIAVFVPALRNLD